MSRRRNKKMFYGVTDRYTDLNEVGLVENTSKDPEWVDKVADLSKRIMSLQMVQMVNQRRNCNCSCDCNEGGSSTVRQLQDLISNIPTDRIRDTKVEEVSNTTVKNYPKNQTHYESDGAIFVTPEEIEEDIIGNIIDDPDITDPSDIPDDSVLPADGEEDMPVLNMDTWCLRYLNLKRVTVTRYITVITTAKSSVIFQSAGNQLSLSNEFIAKKVEYKITNSWFELVRAILSKVDGDPFSGAFYDSADGYTLDRFKDLLIFLQQSGLYVGKCANFKEEIRQSNSDSSESVTGFNDSYSREEIYNRDYMGDDEFDRLTDQFMLTDKQKSMLGTNPMGNVEAVLSDDLRIRGCTVDAMTGGVSCPKSGNPESGEYGGSLEISLEDAEDMLQSAASDNSAFDNSKGPAISPNDIMDNTTPTDQGGKADGIVSGNSQGGSARHDISATFVWYYQGSVNAGYYDNNAFKAYSFQYVPLTDARIPERSKVTYVYRDGTRETVIK